MKIQTLSAAFALSLLAPSALAHVAIENPQATIGASHKAAFRVTHGCDGSPTTKVRVQIPEGIIGVKPMPKAGWDIAVTRGAYAKSYPYHHGSALTEGPKEVTWSGGKLADEHFDEFTLSMFVARELAPGLVYFPVIQECEKGEWRWVDVPREGQDAHALKSPAPRLRLIAQQGREHGAAQKVSDKSGRLSVETPWSRATPRGAKVGGGYLTITNSGKEADRLVSASSPIAGKVELHEMSMDGGIMKMRPLPKGIAVAAGATVSLAPGGLHVMFLDLKQPLQQGERFPARLTFEKAGVMDVTFEVRAIGAGSGGHGGHH